MSSTITVAEIPQAPPARNESPQFIYMGDELVIQGDFPGTRLIGKFKFTYRPWDFGDVMAQARKRVKMFREHRKELDKLRRALAETTEPAKREELIQLIDDEQQVVNETVGLMLDCQAISECVIETDIPGPNGDPIDHKKMEHLKRLPHAAIRYMAQLIGETVGAPPIPEAAIDLIGKQLGK